MPEIKITKEEIEEIVREANKHLIEDRVSLETDPGAFTGMTYPYYGNELTVARKQKLQSYEKYVNTCLQSLKMMVEQVNMDFTNQNIQKSDVDFLINDQLQKLTDATGFTISSLEAIVKNNGLRKATGPQFPAMMEEQEFGQEKVASSDMRKAGVAQGKEAASASGITAQERAVIKQLNDLIIKASTDANIVPGTAGKLIKRLAVELQALIGK